MRGPDLDRYSSPEALRKIAAAALMARDKARMTSAVYGARVSAAIDVALERLTIHPVKPPKKDLREHGEEVAVAVLSDWQLAKVTRTYNSKVCRRRIEAFAEKVISLTKIQRSDHPVRELRIWCLGDIIEGELIFPGQAHLIDSSLYTQLFDGAELLVWFVRAMLRCFDVVRVTLVPGNHGRFGGRQHRDYRPETNADRMLGSMARRIMREEKRVTWNIAEDVLEGGWYAIDDIGGFRTLLFHGDQVQGGLTTENHLKKLILGWKAGALDGGFHDAFMGHYHVVKKFTFNEVTVRVSGSPESDNAYAARSFGSKSRPSQHLQFVKPGKFVTCEYTCWL